MKINQGQRRPWGYGYAWDNLETLTNEVYLFPLNWILRWLREFWSLMLGKRRDRYTKAFQLGYDRGWRRGYSEGRRSRH